MKKYLLIVVSIALVGLTLSFTPNSISADYFAAEDTVKTLKAKQEHYNEAYLIAAILNQHHYSKLPLDDSLSSVIFDEYLHSLDYYHLYFLQSDLDQLEPLRYRLDDLLLQGNIDIAFDIFELFRLRFAQRNTLIATYFDKGFDYTRQESFGMEDARNSWATDQEALNEKWRKVLKSQALSLRLADKPDAEIRQTIEERYARYAKAIDQYNSEDVFQSFMNAVASAYDPHTSYFSPHAAENFEIDMSLSLEGIGARLISDNDYITFTEIMPGGPAFKSGKLLVGDRIVGVAQQGDTTFTNVIGWRVDDAVQLIRGPKGSKVRLQVLPSTAPNDSKPVEMALIREKINLEEQAASKEVIEFNDGNRHYRLGIITIPSFYMDFDAVQRGDKDYRSTNRDVRSLLQELEGEDIDGLIVDLRRNGGGSLQEAIELTGLFIEEGPVVQVRSADGSVDVATDPDPSVVYNGPMAVMINRFSASASEIFAGAIQDYHRGVIIGEQTYGKGTVQNLIDLGSFLSDEDAPLGQIKLTLAKYYRVTGSSTQHLGVTPDIELPSLYPADEYGESAQPNALPWDQIEAAHFRPSGQVNPQLIEKLQQKYMERVENDQELRELMEAISELHNLPENEAISLNEATRRKEMAEREADVEEGTELNGEISPEIKTVSGDSTTVKDVFLRQGIHLLAEMVASLG